MKGDEDHCPRQRDGEKVVAEPSVCVPSVSNQMLVDRFLESVLENKSFRDIVEKTVRLRVDKVDETVTKFIKQTESWSVDTRECFINMDTDLNTLWEKIMGDDESGEEMDKETGLNGDLGLVVDVRSEPSNGELVINKGVSGTGMVDKQQSKQIMLPILDACYDISVPINQTGQPLDTTTTTKGTNSGTTTTKGTNSGNQKKNKGKKGKEAVRKSARFVSEP